MKPTLVDAHFNSLVKTPDGYGLLVGRNQDRTKLLCSRRIMLEKPIKIRGRDEPMVYRVEFGFYPIEKVELAE